MFHRGRSQANENLLSTTLGSTCSVPLSININESCRVLMQIVRGVNSLVAPSLEWGIQQWIARTGRAVSLADVPWLVGPIGTATIGTDIYPSYAHQMHLHLVPDPPNAGLLVDFSQLRSPTFAPSQVHPTIQHFYEQTTAYTFDVWSQWRSILHPFAKVLITSVSRSIQQLNLPLAPLVTSHGMTSEIFRFIDSTTGAIPYTGWLRKLPTTGHVVYAGFYTICTPPAAAGPCVKVVFPLPGGATTVLLQPENQPDGSFVLVSAGTQFGGPGYYRIHQVNKTTYRVKFLPLKERIHVYVDDQHILRTDHTFAFGGIHFLTLHYKMSRKLD